MPIFSVGFTLEGRAAVYYGSASGFAAAPDWFLDGGAANLDLGTSVSTAGDVNGDGFSDIAIGIPGENSDGGRVIVLLGSVSGPGGLLPPSFNAFDGSRVVLQGSVSTYFQKQMAQEVVRRVEGVQEIDNCLEVLWV